MAIEYQPTRHDIWMALLHNLGHSRRTQLLLALVALLFVFTQYFNLSGDMGIVSVLAPLLGAVLVFVVFILALLISVKSDTRMLAIDRDGIETRIGRKAGRIPWAAIESIAATDELVIVTRKNANFFAIPRRAFLNDHQRATFVEMATAYHATANSTGKSNHPTS